MILLDLLKWALDNWENVTISGALLFIIRKLALGLIKREAMRIFNLQENEELSWTRSKVEMLTGEKYTPTHDAWKQVRKSYKRSLKLLPQVIDQAKRLRRKNMLIDKKLVALMVTYGAGIVAKRYGFETPIEVVNAIIDFIWFGVIPLVAALMDPKPKPKENAIEMKGDVQNGFTYVPGADK